MMDLLKVLAEVYLKENSSGQLVALIRLWIVMLVKKNRDCGKKKLGQKKIDGATQKKTKVGEMRN